MYYRDSNESIKIIITHSWLIAHKSNKQIPCTMHILAQGPGHSDLVDEFLNMSSLHQKFILILKLNLHPQCAHDSMFFDAENPNRDVSVTTSTRVSSKKLGRTLYAKLDTYTIDNKHIFTNILVSRV